jgi:prepilin-type N-terminal cleavage/methylation domain-containing protein
MTHRRRPPSGRDGFTLVELMITMVILTVGMLGLLAMQIGSLQNGAKGRHRTGAAMIARDEVERIQTMAFSDAGLDVMDPVVWTTPPWLANTADPNLNAGEVPVTVAQPGGSAQSLVYTVWYKVASDNVASPNPNLRLVDLEVVWNEPDVTNNQPTRTGQPTVAVSTILVDNDR